MAFQLTSPVVEVKAAVLSDCGLYRYTLSRIWSDENNCVAFIGLNPSTADASQDDPTIRRCRGFAKHWGLDGFWMLNLFGLRSTDPKVLKSSGDPVGPDNDKHIPVICDKARVIVACWGNHGQLNSRGRHVMKFLKEFYAGKSYHLGLTGKREPRHPLYLAKGTQRTRVSG